MNPGLHRVTLILLFFLIISNGIISQCSFLTVNAGTNKEICIGQSIQIGGNPSVDNNLFGSTYSITWSPNASISNVYDPNPLVSPLSTTTYTLTVERISAFGTVCIETDDVIVTVNPLPVVSLSNFPDLCLDSSPLNLNQGSPLGGVYSGSGVSNGNFDPLVAGVGSHTINYAYTDLNSCSNSTANTINVNSIPSAVLSPSPDTIVDNYTPTNITWSKCQLFDSVFNFAVVIDYFSTFQNSSSTRYTITFGNGDTIYNAIPDTTYFTTYTNQQNYALSVISEDTLTGCSSVFERNLFWGSNPVLSFPNPGNTQNYCMPSTFSFPIEFFGTNGPNTPGTEYRLIINDGSSDSIFYHPNPASSLM